MAEFAVPMLQKTTRMKYTAYSLLILGLVSHHSLAIHQTDLDAPLVDGTLPYTITLRETSFAPASMPTLHSVAAAKWDGQWILLAGRTAGLHGLSGQNAFDPHRDGPELRRTLPSVLQWHLHQSGPPVSSHRGARRADRAGRVDAGHATATGIPPPRPECRHRHRGRAGSGRIPRARGCLFRRVHASGRSVDGALGDPTRWCGDNGGCRKPWQHRGIRPHFRSGAGSQWSHTSAQHPHRRDQYRPQLAD